MRRARAGQKDLVPIQVICGFLGFPGSCSYVPPGERISMYTNSTQTLCIAANTAVLTRDSVSDAVSAGKTPSRAI